MTTADPTAMTPTAPLPPRIPAASVTAVPAGLISALVCGLAMSAVTGCRCPFAPADGGVPVAADGTPLPVPNSADGRTFKDDVDFLNRFGEVKILRSPEGGVVAVTPDKQARVMTSAVESDGVSLGYINYGFFEARKTGTAFDNYGGEDRFWVAPEAGPYGYFFRPNGPVDDTGNPFTRAAWRTPTALNEGRWEFEQGRDGSLIYRRYFLLRNVSGNDVRIRAERRIRLLGLSDVNSKLQLSIPPGVKWVGFETVNRITNMGDKPFARATGIPAIWILGQFPAFPNTRVVVPFVNDDPRKTSRFINDNYFGKVPADRLDVDEKAGIALFKADGLQVGKIGLAADRSRGVLGSYSESEKVRVLTVVHYDRVAGQNDYVGNEWGKDSDPWGGDVIQSYNDGGHFRGPQAPATPSFYELETLSPAAPLDPGEVLTHVQRTVHFVGERDELDRIAQVVFGARLERITR